MQKNCTHFLREMKWATQVTTDINNGWISQKLEPEITYYYQNDKIKLVDQQYLPR